MIGDGKKIRAKFKGDCAVCSGKIDAGESCYFNSQQQLGIWHDTHVSNFYQARAEHLRQEVTAPDGSVFRPGGYGGPAPARAPDPAPPAGPSAPRDLIWVYRRTIGEREASVSSRSGPITPDERARVDAFAAGA